RDRGRAVSFAVRVSAELGRPVSVADDWSEAALSADIVVTCTTSTLPIVGTGDVRAGAFLAAVGADNPEKHEVDPALLAASRVFTDSVDQAAAIGDLHHAIEAGLMRKQDA